TVTFLGVYVSTQTETTRGNTPEAPSISRLPEAQEVVAEALALARRSADCVVVIPHWGTEGQSSIIDDQRHWARWLVQHGADAVVGSGPHVVQVWETVEGAPVFYSTGNLW